uniref:Alcohol dehydrogenase-like C-terminal domain-containing protein n=1 Tax=Peronospora matthiolae TaxID=2874970 RepID=A0AAV1TAJ0_9STRA
MGYKVVAIDSGKDKRALVQSYGVKHFIDYTTQDVVEQVRAATSGQGAHAVACGCWVNGGVQGRPPVPPVLGGRWLQWGVPKDAAIEAPLSLMISLELRIDGLVRC